MEQEKGKDSERWKVDTMKVEKAAKVQKLKDGEAEVWSRRMVQTVSGDVSVNHENKDTRVIC